MILDKLEKVGLSLQDYKKLGKLANKALDLAERLIKNGKSDLEIVKELDFFFEENGVKKAFPVNLSVNEIAAHYTPYDKEYFFKKEDLIKVDLGIHLNGFIVDTAKTIYLGEDKQKKQLIKASEKALENVEEVIKKGIKIKDIGELIEKTIESFSFKPIYNLGGHSLEQFNLHAGIFIPNYNNKKEIVLSEGVYAIEPFATNGVGFVKDYSFSNILILRDLKDLGRIRIPLTIKRIYFKLFDEFKTLPFSMLDLEKIVGKEKINLVVSNLERIGLIYKYPQLKEKANGLVSQREHTFLVLEDKVVVLTKED